MRSIIIIIDYFGSWPEWFPIYLASCKANATIQWHFHTDCPIPADAPPNTKFIPISFAAYKERVSKLLGISFRPADTYKVCDLRPAYGVLYENEIRNYDYFGFGDIDVVYGNIRNFYTDDVLTHNVISTHCGMISGHLTLIKNEPWLRQSFRRIRGWKNKMEHPRSLRVDEDEFVKVFLPKSWPRRFKHHLFKSKYYLNHYFKEQFTTILKPEPWHDGSSEHPQIWFWENGRLTNNRDQQREFIYLHFMNFRYARYMNPVYGNRGAWEALPRLVHLDPAEIPNGVRIDRTGFHPLN